MIQYIQAKDTQNSIISCLKIFVGNLKFLNRIIEISFMMFFRLLFRWNLFVITQKNTFVIMGYYNIRRYFFITLFFSKFYKRTIYKSGTMKDLNIFLRNILVFFSIDIHIVGNSTYMIIEGYDVKALLSKEKCEEIRKENNMQITVT